MWFKRKDKYRMDDSFVEGIRGLSGQQLAELALSKRQLKDYEESLELSERAYRKFNYLGAVSIHASTLTLMKRYSEAITWLENALREIEGKDDRAILARAEAATNLILLFRDIVKNVPKAEEYLALARKLVSQTPDTKESRRISCGVDVEEAVLSYNKGDYPKAKTLALKRLQFFPECRAARLILSHLEKDNVDHRNIYGTLSADGSIEMPQDPGNIFVRSYRGMEEVILPSLVFGMLFLVARTKGWRADYLFAENNSGQVTIFSASHARKVSEGDAIDLHRTLKMLKPLCDEMGVKEFIEFVSDGAFLFEEMKAE
ncbi:hypothetical protein [Coraliomargarita parva]|uniref:hypothetical protein n=1 Tax=Coraliomargarita parva TaxID=3014050 RepID=UPI0022B40329|nr:hypothetical protein [Coraliomargarita parva]